MPSGFFDTKSNYINGRLVVNKNGRTGALAATGATPIASAVQTAAATGRAGMEARLQAVNAAYYTDARLRTLTTNDIVYALRVQDDNTNRA